MNTLAVTCEDVLKTNDRGTHTVPSPGLYPHQWLWDSCFSAIGWAHINPERAKQELLSLVHGQWHNGMIPHMIFSMEPKYARDRNMWRSWVSSQSPADVATSGITQPPLIAEATWRVGQQLDKKSRDAFYNKMLPVITKYHQWFYKDRDPHGEGLVILIHPYETGLDNTPPWAAQLHQHVKPTWVSAVELLRLDKVINMARRDTRKLPSDQRMHNVEALIVWDAILRLRRKHYDIDKILQRPMFSIIDVSFNSILIRNNQILKDIAKTVFKKVPKNLEANMQKSEEALETLWSDEFELYFSQDFITHKLFREPTIASLLPLYAGCISQERAQSLVDTLMSQKSFWPKYPVPSVPINNHHFDSKRYWQGPTWINTNWLIIDGLKRYGFEKEAQSLTGHTLDLVKKGGVWEYYNPKNGDGLGSSDFSWSAALTLDLLQQN